ncbi:hypothetical protein ACHQM5_012449 [Ranunculus cassubicifolius]
MSTVSCESCVSFIWEHLCRHFARKTMVDLPYEILADILSRLPAELVFSCEHACKPLGELMRTPSFVNIHLTRATGVYAFNYFSLDIDYDKEVKDSARNIIVYLRDEVTQKLVSKSIKMELGNTRHKKTCMPTIYGSYNGFLLFRNIRYDVVLFIWNPVTQEHATVVAPHPGYRVRGLFFHKATQEYRVLYVSADEVDFRYYILSLKTKSTRRIKSFSHPPCSLTNPVILKEVLHWMVCEDSYNLRHKVYPPCSTSILLFDMNSEEFSTMSHPGSECLGKNCLEGNHSAMKLIEMEGFLGLCDQSSHKEIVIWILEDAEENGWVKRFVLIEPIKLFYDMYTVMPVQVMHIFKDEVLLLLYYRELFMYNMRRRTLKRVNNFSDTLVYAVCHVNTFAAIHVDNIVYVSADVAGESRGNIEWAKLVMDE